MADFIKYDHESFQINVDFSTSIGSSDTIASSSTVTAEDENGSDASSAILEGKTQSDGKLFITVKDGVPGMEYALLFKAISTNGKQFEQNRTMKIRV